MSLAIVNSVNRMPPGRGRSARLIDGIRSLLSQAADRVENVDYQRGARIMLGRDAETQNELRRGSAKVMQDVMNAATKLGVTKGTPAENKMRAYKAALSPAYSNLMRAVPATVALGSLRVGSALSDAVFESEDERKLREVLEYLNYFS